jgi:uncharacterized membrane protein YfcA
MRSMIGQSLVRADLVHAEQGGSRVRSICAAAVRTFCTAIYCRGLYLLWGTRRSRITSRKNRGAATSTESSLLTMRIAKPILMVTTPIGVLEGFYECYKLAGGLVILMVAMVGVLGVALATVVATIRRESAASAKDDQCRS